MQANWEEKYFTQIGIFFSCNRRMKVSHLGDMSQFIETAPKIGEKIS